MAHLSNQALLFRDCDYGDGGAEAGAMLDTVFTSFICTLDNRNFPKLKLSFWRWHSSTIDASDWVKIDYWNGGWTNFVWYPGNGADDQLWHKEEYDLSSFGTNAGFRLQWRANFSKRPDSVAEVVCMDDICLKMETPDALYLGEETIPINSITANFQVSIAPTAPTGVVDIFGKATCNSLLYTGVYPVDPSVANDQWTISPMIVETYSDAGFTIKKDKFGRGATVFMKATGLSPGDTVSIEWYDQYNPPGTLRYTDDPVTVQPDGSATANHTLNVATHRYGVWKLIVKKGAVPQCNGSFHLLETPQLISLFNLGPSTVAVGDTLNAAVTVHACAWADQFETYALGNLPAPWTRVAGAGSVEVSNAAGFNHNPADQFLRFNTAGATTMAALRTIDLTDYYQPVLAFDYSTAFPAGSQVSIFANTGGPNTTLGVITTSLGAGVWSSMEISLPANLENVPVANFRFEASIVGGAGDVCLDNVHLKGIGMNHDSVDLTPRTWLKASAQGDALLQSGPTPGSANVSGNSPALFQAVYKASAVTVVPNLFSLEGPGAPKALADGITTVGQLSCNAPNIWSTGISIQNRSLALAPPLIVDMGSVEPAAVSAAIPVTVNNTGDLPLNSVKWEFHNLTFGSYFIPYPSIVGDPSPIGAIAIGGNAPATLQVTVPPGTEAGTYQANQFVYEDLNSDGISTNEPIGQFSITVDVSPTEKLAFSPALVDVGAWAPGDTTTEVSFLVSNVGNVDLTRVRLVPQDLPGGGGFFIPAGAFVINPGLIGLVPKTDSRWQSFHAIVPPGQDAPRTYTGNFLLLDDHVTQNGTVDPGEASILVPVQIVLGTADTMQLNLANPQTVSFPAGVPGDVVSVVGGISLKNTGSVNQSFLKMKWVNLDKAPDAIPSSNLVMVPDPLPSVAPLGSTLFDLFLQIPYGTPVGAPFTGVQIVFNDRNQNGVPDGPTEAVCDLTVNATVNALRKVTIPDEVVNLGSGKVGQTLTANFDVMNLGNVTCDTLKWRVITVLNDGLGTTIPQVNVNLPAAGEFEPTGTPWSLPVAMNSKTITVSITLPAVPSGVYTGRWALYDDVNGNNAPDDPPESYDEFGLTLEVGNPAIDVLAASLNLSGNPAANSDVGNIPVQNTGAVTLTDVKYIKPTLTGVVHGKTISPAFQVYAPDPVGVIGVGATVYPALYVAIPGNLDADTYTGILNVFQDQNHDGFADGLPDEVQDQIAINLVVNAVKSAQITPNPLDVGGGAAGETLVSDVFSVKNLGNVDLDKFQAELPTLVSGGNTILSSQISFPTAMPWLIPWVTPGNEILRTIQVIIPPGTPTGLYTGTIRFYQDDLDPFGSYTAGESYWDHPMKISVGSKNLDVLNVGLNFGQVVKGNPSTTLNFTLQNTGTVELSKLKITRSALAGGGEPSRIRMCMWRWYSIPWPLGFCAMFRSGSKPTSRILSATTPGS